MERWKDSREPGRPNHKINGTDPMACSVYMGVIYTVKGDYLQL